MLSKTEISQIYVTLLGRASEGNGNLYWQNLNLSLTQTIENMLNLDIVKEYFGKNFDDDRKFIEQIYFNNLAKNKEDDKAGIEFWTNALKSNPRAVVVKDLILASTNKAHKNSKDLKTKQAYELFKNKVEISNYVADKIKSIPEDGNLEIFKHYLKLTTFNDTKTAKELIDKATQKVIKFTTNLDEHLIGTDKDDFFEGNITGEQTSSSQHKKTINNFESVDGKKGYDTLTMYSQTPKHNVENGDIRLFEIKNIEKINLINKHGDISLDYDDTSLAQDLSLEAKNILLYSKSNQNISLNATENINLKLNQEILNSLSISNNANQAIIKTFKTQTDIKTLNINNAKDIRVADSENPINISQINTQNFNDKLEINSNEKYDLSLVSKDSNFTLSQNTSQMLNIKSENSKIKPMMSEVSEVKVEANNSEFDFTFMPNLESLSLKNTGKIDIKLINTISPKNITADEATGKINIENLDTNKLQSLKLGKNDDILKLYNFNKKVVYDGNLGDDTIVLKDSMLDDIRNYKLKNFERLGFDIENDKKFDMSNFEKYDIFISNIKAGETFEILGVKNNANVYFDTNLSIPGDLVLNVKHDTQNESLNIILGNDDIKNNVAYSKIQIKTNVADEYMIENLNILVNGNKKHSIDNLALVEKDGKKTFSSVENINIKGSGELNIESFITTNLDASEYKGKLKIKTTNNDEKSLQIKLAQNANEITINNGSHKIYAGSSDIFKLNSDASKKTFSEIYNFSSSDKILFNSKNKVEFKQIKVDESKSLDELRQSLFEANAQTTTYIKTFTYKNNSYIAVDNSAQNTPTKNDNFIKLNGIHNLTMTNSDEGNFISI